MKTYTFTISGMTCHACESLIAMDLEELNLPAPQTIDHAAGVMIIALEEADVQKVKQATEQSGKYTVTNIA